MAFVAGCEIESQEEWEQSPGTNKLDQQLSEELRNIFKQNNKGLE